MRLIEIPLKEAESVVEIPVVDLPESFDQIFDLLVSESCQLSLFVTFALEYEKLGMLESCIKLLEEGLRMNQSGRKEDLTALNPLTACYLKMAYLTSSSDKKRFNEILDKVTGLYNQCDSIDIHEEKTWLGKGIVFLLRKVFDRASFQFDTLLERKPQMIPALIGKAISLYRVKDFKSSLKYFTKAFTTCPSFIYSRYGMGLCFLELSKFESAEKCFKRVLALDPNHLPSTIALGVLELHSKDPSLIQKGALKMKQVYQADKNYPVVLNELASHFFYRKEYEKAEKLLLKALSCSDVDESRAESAFGLGKIYHVLKRYNEAFSFYSQSLKYNREMLPAKLYLAQIFIYQDNYSSALKFLSELSSSDDALVLKIAGFLSLKDRKFSEAKTFLEKLVLHQKSDPDLKIALAKCNEELDPERSLEDYAWLFSNHKQLVNAMQFKNNYSCLLYRANRLNEAESMCRSVLESLESNTDLPLSLIIKYNLACILDESGETEEALEILNAITKTAPAFVFGHLRMGVSFHRRGLYQEAIDHFNDAIGLNSDNEEEALLSWLCLANLQFKMKNYMQVSCRKSYEKILMRPKSRHNQYALVSLGNLHWKIAVSSPGGKSRDDNFKRAAELFTKALDLKPSNVYAANGLGIVCALRRNWKDARDIFLSTKQECNIIDVWGNLGIAYFELGQYASALNCIELCLPKSESNFDLLLLKAKCFFCQGKFERNDETVRKAIKEMEKITASNSNEQLILKFNMALCKQEIGAMILKKGHSLRSSEDLTASSSLISESQRMMEEIVEQIPENAPFDKKIIQQRIEYGLQCEKSFNLQWEKQLQEDRLKQQRMDDLKRARDEQHEKELLEEEEKRKKKLALDAELDLKQKEMLQKKQETIDFLLQKKVSASSPSKSSGRKKAKPNPNDDEDDDEEMEDEIDFSSHRVLDNENEQQKIIEEEEDEEKKRSEALSRLREMKLKKNS